MTDPNQLVVYKKLPEWTKDTLPPGFQKPHNTKVGTWGRLTITKGELTYFALDEHGTEQARYQFSPAKPPPLIQPQAWHRIEPGPGELRCYVEFLCQPHDYYRKKYDLSAPHSEVVALSPLLQGGDALDLGCGRGRNALYLCHQGFQVQALDKNPTAIDKLRGIIAREQLGDKVQPQVADLEQEQFTGSYDLVLSTVVMQFLVPAAIHGLIRRIQDATKPSGLNLIVAPMSVARLPCPIDLPFTFKQDELRDYYQGWQIKKYNENLGEFHRKGPDGRNLACHFATLVAAKPGT